MSWLGTLGKVLGGVGSVAAAPFTGGTSLAWLPAALGAGGAALGAIGQSKAQNRDAQLGAQYDLERLLMDREGLETARDRDQFSQTLQREQEGRESGTDAWKKLLSAQRVLSPPQRSARAQANPYAAPQRQITDMERQGADAMTQEVMARLQGGNPIQAPTRRAPLGPPAMDPRLMKPGGMESTLGWLAPLLGGLGGVLGKQGGPVQGVRPPGGTPMTFLDPNKIGGSGSFRY